MLAVTFPGQGSQRPEMGAPWRHHPAWSLIPRLADAAGCDLEHLLLRAGADELRATANAQVATFALSLVVLEAARAAGVRPGAAAGHSLGEYTALVAAGALDPAAGAELVAARGAAMQVAADAQAGTMAAVLGLGDDQVAEACEHAGPGVWVANLNAPGQAVIAGTDAAVALAGEAARALGARRIVPLPVGGAFHCPLMAPAGDRLAGALEAAALRDPAVPVVANVDAATHHRADDWRTALAAQLTSPVLWRRSLHTLHDLGVSALVELGPGDVLTGLAKRTVPELPRLSVSTPDDLAALAALAAESPSGPAAPDGDHPHTSERLIVSPAAGVFSPADHLGPGLPVEPGHVVGRVGDADVRSRFAGRIAGVLALPGERLLPTQPVAWLRAW